MKIASVVARYLLGFVFTVFGLNGFLHFLHQPPPASPLAMQYMTVMMASHYFFLVFLIQLAAGLLLLFNRFVPLALTLLAPVLVNILLFHTLIAHDGWPVALFVTLLWFVLFTSYRRAFTGILQAMATPVGG